MTKRILLTLFLMAIPVGFVVLIVWLYTMYPVVLSYVMMTFFGTFLVGIVTIIAWSLAGEFIGED